MLGVMLQMTVVDPYFTSAEGEGILAGRLDEEEEEEMGPRLRSTCGKVRGEEVEEEEREEWARWLER